MIQTNKIEKMWVRPINLRMMNTIIAKQEFSALLAKENKTGIQKSAEKV